ncbi:MAG: LacI family DNA-binding transcriptional regulator [Novosphingobium sp.]|nr:LacI family DNA-binding transcriptional regulator [Novosphingobium sp.]
MNARKTVTIEDVALAAGVSRQTVSRVINRGPNVKPAVRERIDAAIERLGYVPNLSARRMGGGKSFMILAINDRQRTLENWEAGRGNDWVDQMLFGGMTECEKHGYHLVFELIDAGADDAPRQLSRVIASLRPDGVVLTPPHSDDQALVSLLDERGIACARIGQREPSGHLDIFMDERGAAMEATRHLVELGHRRLTFIAGSPGYGNSRRRVEGFQSATRAAGISKDGATVLDGDFHFSTTAAVLEPLLKSRVRPTAIIADNDEMAFATLHVADRCGIEVPRGLSVISFEDTPGVRFSVPPLTAIRQPTARMIACACEKLIESASGKRAAGSFEIPHELIMRATTGPPPR